MKQKQIQKIAKILYQLERENPESRQEAVDHLIKELQEKGKLSLLSGILKELERIIKTKQGVLVFAREDIDKQLKQRTKQKLEECLDGLSFLDIKVDSNIIGGFVAKTENYLIDGSVKGLLKKLENSLIS